MADKGKAKDKKEKGKKKTAQAVAPGKLTMRGRLFLVVVILAGLIFLPTSILLFVGMLPTVMICFVSVRRNSIRISTVAAMNLAGCIPFVLKLWQGENNFATSFNLLTEPMTIVVIYGAAVTGYVIDWVVVGVVSSVTYLAAESRLKAIDKRQADLVEEWGKEVTVQGQSAPRDE